MVQRPPQRGEAVAGSFGCGAAFVCVFGCHSCRCPVASPDRRLDPGSRARAFGTALSGVTRSVTWRLCPCRVVEPSGPFRAGGNTHSVIPAKAGLTEWMLVRRQPIRTAQTRKLSTSGPTRSSVTPDDTKCLIRGPHMIGNG